jgi:hypothetical protein
VEFSMAWPTPAKQVEVAIATIKFPHFMRLF